MMIYDLRFTKTVERAFHSAFRIPHSALFLTLALVTCHRSVQAADRITATVAITNAPTTNGMTFVITTTSASTRTWTNSVVVPATQILTNDTAAGIATNLNNQLQNHPPAGINVAVSGTNVSIYGTAGLPLTISFSGNYARVSYATQAVTSAFTVRVPYTVESEPMKTNISSGLSFWLEYSGNTNPINQNSFSVSELVGLTNAQTISGVKVFTGTNTHNGPILKSPVLTNGINYNLAFSSPGIGLSSEQFGSGALATNDRASAFGYLALAGGIQSLAVGQQSVAGGDNSVAIGSGSSSGYASIAIGGISSGYQSIAAGLGASATGSNSVAIGLESAASFANSVAIGTGSATTSSNQIMLGSPGINTVVQNDGLIQSNLVVGGYATFTGGITNLSGRGAATFNSSVTVTGVLQAATALLVSGGAQVVGSITNATFTGTNNFPAGADITFGRYAITSLANGNNAGVIVGTNVFIEVSGPSAAFTLNGLAGGRDGKLLIIVNQTGFDMTVAHQSGVDATAANRIINLTGADRTTTGNGAATLIYSGAASRWILISLDP